VEQSPKLVFDIADDIVIINSGAVAYRGTAAETRTNEALITQHLGVF
jgi:branched-chain amino acid transport system ATP-binding protein